MAADTPIRVVLADDEPLLRHGLRVLLTAGGRVEVVAEAGDGAEAIAAVRLHRPDVLLLDVQMPRMDGLTALRELADVPVATAILTTFDLDDYVARALDLGAAGFLLKDAEPDVLVRAVVDLAAGGAVLDPRITARLLPRLRGAGLSLRRAQAIDALSARERQVLEQLADGRANAAIAETLGLTEATVKSYVSQVLTKLGVHNRVQAALLLHGVDVLAEDRL
ncbi:MULTISPECIES: response regulator [Actinokineospora]|uniref:DNA-binding response regulator n=1 Tax=Actinokineospora fastidiosa TaxID=1816 RepID=A0A918GUA5_9PSEU|nr:MULTISPECIES: response regulator transcription factor [Actinokineospora]UVS78365.1 Protease production enhancer protein [Actinokineospora sp. UTMC 2448]GGS59329.1 DNA-binding response regulator [Actinokineospora fastidiosa]